MTRRSPPTWGAEPALRRPRARGRRRALALALASFALAAAGAPTPGAGSAVYLYELVERARALDLAAKPGWRALLHYRRRPLGLGLQSHADDPDFFLSPRGRDDPYAELEATLRAFFDDRERHRIGDRELQHAQCAFVARYHWLREALAFDPARLPERPCAQYRAFLESLDPAGVTFVFAEAFMNNPASMFGHTLLRVDPRQAVGDEDELRYGLLGWAVNFAGATGEEGGPLYALKGLTGLYQGFYDVGPYARKVKQYGDWEDRDIWEYRLALTEAEIERMLMHLWELQGIAFDYYYFDENCSYQLLALLDVARPGLALAAELPFWVIPADTVRTVMRRRGLLAGVHFRPSAGTALRAHLGTLAADERRLALALADGTLATDGPDVAALGERERAAVLSVAYDALRHDFLAGRVGREASAGRARRLLVARSRVDVPGSVFAPVPAPRVRPEEGHGTARAALAAGWRDGDAFVEVRFRPAFHDLLDPQGGYTEGAQIDFLDVALRVFPESGRVRLHEAVLLDVTSLVPWDRLFRHWSYTFDTGLRPRLVPDGAGDLDPEPVWRTRGGLGLSARPLRAVLAYALAEATSDIGGALEHDVAIGVGARAGVFVSTPTDRWRAHLFANATRFALGDETTSWAFGCEQRLLLGRGGALTLQVAYRRDFRDDWLDLGVRWNVYF
jgi:hypothetical protein